MHECLLEDGVYREGEIMYPWMDQCYRCICDSGFNSTLSIPENPNCKANEFCNIELYQLTKFQRGCAPVYYGVNPCCPTSWRCRKYSISLCVSIYQLCMHIKHCSHTFSHIRHQHLNIGAYISFQHNPLSKQTHSSAHVFF